MVSPVPERADPMAIPAFEVDLPGDLSAAVARCGIARTKNLVQWQRLPDLKTCSLHQRNCVLHPEFVRGKYAFYTRPMADFAATGSGDGIGWGLCDDIENAAIEKETIIDPRIYHTIKEGKNGLGPAPIKTRQGWLHLARQHLENSAFAHSREALANVFKIRSQNSRAVNLLAEVDRSARHLESSSVAQTLNPYFTRAEVNRTWAQFFGTGLVDPVDELTGENSKPSHQEYPFFSAVVMESSISRYSRVTTTPKITARSRDCWMFIPPK